MGYIRSTYGQDIKNKMLSLSAIWVQDERKAESPVHVSTLRSWLSLLMKVCMQQMLASGKPNSI